MKEKVLDGNSHNRDIAVRLVSAMRVQSFVAADLQVEVYNEELNVIVASRHRLYPFKIPSPTFVELEKGTGDNTKCLARLSDHVFTLG
ncbi:hypothetical protein P8452_66309 [Trifolium repens]|nr:hypothetical protein P8452_66309 [Trifolium repens]